MPIHYSIDSSRRLVLSTWIGEIGYDELLAYFRTLASDSAFHPTFKELADLSPASLVSLRLETLMNTRDYDPFSRCSRRAIFAPKDVTFGISQMYAALWGESLVVFRELGRAKEWIESS